MITYIHRKRVPGGFSIERLFDPLRGNLEARGIRIERLELPHVSNGIRSVARNIWHVFRRNPAAVTHITGDVHYAMLLRPFSRTIITVHDCGVLDRGTGIKRFVLWLLWFRLPMGLAAAVTTISEQTRREILRVVSIPETKVKVIPNFVGPEFRFAPAEFRSERPRILHIGTKPNKNLPRVISALRGLDCVLVIVGALPQPLLEWLARSGIRHESHVNVDSRTIVELYRTCDIVSFPSTYEGFGLPIIEAQATGRPVLTSNIEPMRSVAGPSGALLVDPTSVAEIRRGFETLIVDRNLREQIVGNGRVNCGKYSIDRVAASFEQLYRSMDEA